MKFIPTEFEGVWVIEPEPHTDERGFFARMWCRDEFEQHGIDPELVQCNVSFNQHKGTVRGMHFQNAPHEEAKLVRCTHGAIFDVIVDLREDSPTYLKQFRVQLSASQRNALFIPKGFAHGFQTLEARTEVLYQMTTRFVADAANGIRWNDPALQVAWPLPISSISAKDEDFANFCANRRAA